MLIELEKMEPTQALVVPAVLVDEHMAAANGEYIKVYLYLLRHYQKGMEPAKIADALHMLEGDVLRALKYWAQKGLLKLRREKEEEKEQKKEEAEASPEPLHRREAVDLQLLENDTAFKTLLFVAQRYVNKIFGPTDTQILAYLYVVLKMPIDLIEYLIELCVSRGKPSLRYMEAAALEWHKNGIDSVEKAKQNSSLYHGRIWPVMKALGISARNPVKEELAYMDKWFDSYAFQTELIIEACSRTIMRTGKASFQYADSILTKWYKEKVRSLADLERLDKEHEKRAQTEARPSIRLVDKGKNRFNNFEQRDDDLDAGVAERIMQEF